MEFNLALKLATRNMKSNKQVYIPFVVSSTLIVSMFYMIASLITNSFVTERGESLLPLFRLGAIVVAIFSLVFILYANSFLMKRRKKEIGLFNILGLEKGHIAKIIAIETIITFAVSLITGLIIGSLLGQLMFYAIDFILILPQNFIFTVGILPILLTAALFGVIFIVAYSINVVNIQFSNPIELLKGGQSGEKEPKSSPILFVLGLISMGAGYYLSLTIKDPIQAIVLFTVAVVLVMLGTYLLFNAGTIIILKALKKRKNFYYQPGPFISISGMLYRMKQHATGLANLCLLSAMVLITVSTTTALYTSAENLVRLAIPVENTLNVSNVDDLSESEFEETKVEPLLNIVREETENSAVDIEDLKSYSKMSFYDNQIIDDELIYRYSGKGVESDAVENVNTVMITLQDYNELTGQSLTLENGAIYVDDPSEMISGDTLDIEGVDYRINQLDDVPDYLVTTGPNMNQLLVVLPDMDTLMAIRSVINGYLTDFTESVSKEIIWSTTGSQTEELAYAEHMTEVFRDRSLGFPFYQNREQFRINYYDITGGFLFLGIYLGFLFVIGTVLITYFKQISEGYEDRARIQAMQKVGLDKKMTRKATRSQVIWMFLLPLVVAIIHTIVAYPILFQMLSAIGLITHTLLAGTVAIVALAFSLIYGIVYLITSKIYLKIVE